MRDQRRFITTRTIRDAAGAPIGLIGHLVGSGPRSVISIHRRVSDDISRQITRRAQGRHVWWPGLFGKDEPVVNPDLTPMSHQQQRKLARQAAKAQRH